MTIEEFLAEKNQPKYRLIQFYRTYYQNLIENFDQITSWPKALRDQAKTKVNLSLLKLRKTQVSAKKDTIKVLFERNNHSNQFLEAVLMRHRDHRNTVCVSCMIGCPMGCVFCATGTMGFVDNLTAAEIVEQVLYFARLLKQEDQKVTNIVFMGMGEPMINLTNTQEAIAVLTDKNKFDMSISRITVSTCGVVASFKKFINDGYKGRLAISLHAPDQKLRERIMPIAKTNVLAELFQTIDLYIKKTNKRVSYEYVLIKDLNDQIEHATALAKLMQNKLAHVNLIPYNPIPGKVYQAPSRNTIFAFASILEKARVPHTIRITMGADIQAACGQLATQN